MTSNPTLRAARRCLMAASLTAATLIPGTAQGQEQALSFTGENRTTPQVIAHRGGAMDRPENTMAAFHRAAEIGVEIIEFDMEMTADDEIVIYHDTAINSSFCTPDAGSGVKPGPVRALSLVELRQFDCGAGVRPSYAVEGHATVPGERIPTLDEAFSALREKDVLFFAETKIPKSSPDVPDVDPVLFANKFAEAVSKYGLEDRIILQSFDFRTIDTLHRINPKIRTCLLGAQKLTRDYLPLLRKHNASCIVLGREDVDADQVQALKRAGILVYSGVVDNAEEWRRHIELGVDAVFTNDADGLVGYLKGAAGRN